MIACDEMFRFKKINFGTMLQKVRAHKIKFIK